MGFRPEHALGGDGWGWSFALTLRTVESGRREKIGKVGAWAGRSENRGDEEQSERWKLQQSQGLGAGRRRQAQPWSYSGGRPESVSAVSHCVARASHVPSQGLGFLHAVRMWASPAHKDLRGELTGVDTTQNKGDLKALPDSRAH